MRIVTRYNLTSGQHVQEVEGFYLALAFIALAAAVGTFIGFCLAMMVLR